MSSAKIRLLTSVTSTHYSYAAGEVVSVTLEIAKDLIQAGHAVPENDSPANQAEKPAEKSLKGIEKRQ